MSDSKNQKKKKPYGKTIFWGIISAIAYITLFTYQETVMVYFTRGGWYAGLPVITVFFFSFVHGAFCSYLLSVMGIEAAKRKR